MPFQLRTGKALAQSRHTLTLGFKKPARRMFKLPDEAASAARPNEISFELSEPGVIWIDFLAKQPGASMDLGPASLTFRYGDSFDIANELQGYERLLHDTMLGDHTLFTSADGIERLWEVSTPLLEQPPERASLRPRFVGPRSDRPARRPAPLAPALRRAPLAMADGVARVVRRGRPRGWHHHIIVHPNDNRRHEANSSVRSGGLQMAALKERRNA